MKCLRSIKNITKKDNERIAKKKVVRVAPNLKKIDKNKTTVNSSTIIY